MLPNAPLIVLTNEFFDALPIHQAVKTPVGWCERQVGLNDRGELAFGVDPRPLPALAQKLNGVFGDAPLGAIYEWRTDEVLAELAPRLRAHGGALLVIDYGHAKSGIGDTLQAVQAHRPVDPLEIPGDADLSAHVDFGAFAAAADRFGLSVAGPVTQREFLQRLGIEARAERLSASATPEQKLDIEGAVSRLLDPDPSGMGTLFKVMAVTYPALPALPGFES
jgi:SAM-dependent MidA family methyltransferase